MEAVSSSVRRPAQEAGSVASLIVGDASCKHLVNEGSARPPYCEGVFPLSGSSVGWSSSFSFDDLGPLLPFLLTLS